GIPVQHLRGDRAPSQGIAPGPKTANRMRRDRLAGRTCPGTFLLVPFPGLDLLRESWPFVRASVVPVDALAPLVPFLRLDRQGRDRARVEALQGNRLAGLLAIAVGAVVQPLQCRVDLGNELALAVTGTQFDRT